MFSSPKTTLQSFCRYHANTYRRATVSGVAWFSRHTWNSRRAWRSLGGKERRFSQRLNLFYWSHMTSLDEPIRAHHGPWRASGSNRTILSLRSLEAQKNLKVCSHLKQMAIKGGFDEPTLTPAGPIGPTAPEAPGEPCKHSTAQPALSSLIYSIYSFIGL